MRDFADLFDALDRTSSTRRKVHALEAYFRRAPPHDASWALFLLMGRRLKRVIPPQRLVEWTYQLTGLPGWLVAESYAAVGDLAETTALLLDRQLPEGTGESLPLSRWIEDRLLPLRDEPVELQQAAVTRWWSGLPRRELFLLNKMLTGELRVGVSDTLVVRALAEVAGVTPAEMAHRVMGAWTPSAEHFARVTAATHVEDDLSRPYPFYLASPLDAGGQGAPSELGELGEWLAEWKWDGIRAQLIRRGGATFLWSRGEELITHRFPELRDAGSRLAEGTVLDGEVLAWCGEGPLPFAVLQTRIGRQKLTPAILEKAPVVFMAFDLLEQGGADQRERQLEERRELAARLVREVGVPLRFSQTLSERSWADLVGLRVQSRQRNVEGLMLKRRGSPYLAGRKRGDWWKWKIDPYAVDAVLVYAHPGHGKRANLFTDYTFAVWSGGELVPVAKAYSGLTDEEIAELDRWIRSHTRERFGPVRAVDPVHVFELHFEGIAPSPRHRSGIALRFPRIARWRSDKKPADADSLDSLLALLKVRGAQGVELSSP